MAVSDRDKSVLESIFNPLLPLGGDVPQQEVSRDAEDMSESTQLAKEYETSGVHKAEAGLFDEAMELFDKAISATPMRASCYNNRAQLFRLKGDITNALADLNTAIELSGGRGTAASQAYTQQGLLLRLEGKEEAALEAFHKAAALGNAFAKTMVVQLNPYAALCNAMLAEAIDKLQQGETS